MRELTDIVRMFERRRDEPLALATLVKTQGSSYRKSGARMLIAADGNAVGSLSGGCLEEEVVERAHDVIRTGEPAWMEFDTRRRFGCHGMIEILIEHVRPAFLKELAGCIRERRSATAATVFSRRALNVGSWFMSGSDNIPEETLVQQIDPPLQLLIVGHGPDSPALRAFSEALGWQMSSIESAKELHGFYDERTAAIVKTHNYGRDFAALRALLPLGLRYVGLLGQRRRRDQLLGDLLDTGTEIGGNLFSPAGLDLGGDSPEAIALAIIAEIQSVFAGGSRESLRDRRAPIHASSSINLPVSS